jgi:hypothetical protein
MFVDTYNLKKLLGTEFLQLSSTFQTGPETHISMMKEFLKILQSRIFAER